ncbi:PAAR domain-containing protein [Herbaspirillum huttiense]|uniref:PAAR domain-containing protein n=2 Tax=Herbaspirillum huttiense TaxID=863372 RepID=A0AAJ2H7F7_9BURK|nr:PAAR domain-containing protein [Herbaspirillum huttiense]MDR9835326.1 PAAR domain-containing protein [Herbaspirillum huttiense]
MKIIGWIRYGDKAACGGTVIEGDQTCRSHGRAYAFQGARVACRKDCIISDGFPRSTLTNGRAQVIHGMKTSAGCPLLSTLNEVDGVGNASGEAVTTNFYQTTQGDWLPKFGPEHLTEESPDEQVRAIDGKTGEPIPDLAYYIKAPDGTTYSGYTNANGLCERVTTYHPEELSVWFGEDAETKMREG